MYGNRPQGLRGIPSATGGIARLACARMRELGKDVAAVLSKADLTAILERLERITFHSVTLGFALLTIGRKYGNKKHGHYEYRIEEIGSSKYSFHKMLVKLFLPY